MSFIFNFKYIFQRGKIYCGLVLYYNGKGMEVEILSNEEILCLFRKFNVIKIFIFL